MDRRIDAEIAGARLGEIVDTAVKENARFIVRRGGEPAAVIMSIEDFIRTIAPPPEWLRKIWAGAKERGVDRMTMEEIDAEIAAVRRERAGRGADGA